MQFIKSGPDVPDTLLQAHEDGDVVFFCGAGISCTAGLPLFETLVKQIIEKASLSKDEIERDPFLDDALNSKNYDTAIHLLESKSYLGRDKVRQYLSEILLSPNFNNRNAKRTHKALLTLSSYAEKTRLVTTNFDRIFETIIEEEDLNIPHYSAPALPIPKGRWNGLVYLHGILPEETKQLEQNQFDHLVLSSGDFGLAYLRERWAARFISELFRNYTVCFVGYSLNDPVMRYMMDALAADRMMGESQREVFAFVPAKKVMKKKFRKIGRVKRLLQLFIKKQRHIRIYIIRCINGVEILQMV